MDSFLSFPRNCANLIAKDEFSAMIREATKTQNK